ncbi:hypothetical protein Barb4_02311 [Bacteroidales bacterium Barb4]|nr:hypothetical protein Barb4_02311 [Bacteroidales bacterium Barb4]
MLEAYSGRRYKPEQWQGLLLPFGWDYFTRTGEVVVLPQVRYPLPFRWHYFTRTGEVMPTGRYRVIFPSYHLVQLPGIQMPQRGKRFQPHMKRSGMWG